MSAMTETTPAAATAEATPSAGSQLWVPRLWTPSADLAAKHEPWLAPINLRRDLVEQGMTDKAIRRQWKGGVYARPRWGAYTAADDYEPLDPVGQHAIRSRAVLLQSAAEVSLSHGSALVWFGGPDWGLDLSDVDVTRHDGKAGRHEAGVRQHRGVIVDGDVITAYGMTLMAPVRAALEFATVAAMEAALAQVNHLLHTGQVTIDELWARYEDMKDWPGSLATEIVLRLADARIESLLETLFYALCFRNSLPMPEPQYPVQDGAVEVARLDFAWPARRKYAECDGKAKYKKLLKPGQDVTEVVLREKERERLVRRLIGFDGERFTWADVLHHERRTVARLWQFLEE
jgi:hypothetical protein